MKTSQRGFIVPLLLTVIAVLAIGGGIYIYHLKWDPSPMAEPSITLVSPNGGESWSIGSRQTVRWESNFSGGVVSIFLINGDFNQNTDNYQSEFLLGNYQPNSGSFELIVPDSISGEQVKPGSKYKIELVAYRTTADNLLDYDHPVKVNLSSNYFSLTN